MDMTARWVVLVILSWLILNVSSVGIKRRIQEPPETDGAQQDAAASSSSTARPRGGLRSRVAPALTAPAPDKKGPFTRQIVKEWAEGACQSLFIL